MGKEVVRKLHDDKIDHKEVPAYLVQYFGAHLDRDEIDLSDNMLLVHRKWCDAWEAFDGTNADFLKDVARAKQKARELNRRYISDGNPSPHLGKEIKCQLVEASIRGLTANIPEELPVQLLTAGIWTANQLLTYIEQLVKLRKKARLIITAMPHLNEYAQTQDFGTLVC